MKESFSLFLLTLFFAQVGLGQQRMMIRANPDSSLIISELGLLITLQNDQYVVTEVLPFPDKQENAVQKNDVLFGINGKTGLKLNEIRDIYQKTEPEQTIKVGFRSEEKSYIVKFVRKERKGMMRMQIEDENGMNSQPLMPIGILLTEKEKSITVETLLPFASPEIQKSIKEKDVILGFEKGKNQNLEQIQQSWDKLKIGDKTTLYLKRDGKDVSFELIKPEPPQGNFVIKREIKN